MTTAYAATDTRVQGYFTSIQASLDQTSASNIQVLLTAYQNNINSSNSVGAKITDLLTLETAIDNYIQTGNAGSPIDASSYALLAALYDIVDREKLNLQVTSLGIRGLTGDKGARGERGLHGDKGLDGDKGRTGLPGRTGDIGPRGPVGKLSAAEDNSVTAAKIKVDSGPFNIALIPDLAEDKLDLTNAIQVGTLGSFYSCASLDDTAPSLIATGSNTLSGKVLAMQQCNNWALMKEWTTINSKITTDTSNSAVYVSTQNTGGCFNAVGGLQTFSAYVPCKAGEGTWYETTILPISVTCNSDGQCATVETNNANFIVPSMTVTCIDSVCSTPPTNIPLSWGCTLELPSIPVGFIETTAGSLSSLCLYFLDH